jgi:hypothetical protein
MILNAALWRAAVCVRPQCGDHRVQPRRCQILEDRDEVLTCRQPPRSVDLTILAVRALCSVSPIVSDPCELLYSVYVTTISDLISCLC